MSAENTIFNPIISNIEKLINKVLQYDPHSFQQMSEFSGNVILVDIQEIYLKLFLLPSEKGLHISLNEQPLVDVTIKGRPSSLFSLLLNNSERSSVFPKDLEIKGDIHLAQRFQALMQDLDIDWEECLSQYMGDTAARKLGNILSSSRRFLKDTHTSLSRNMSEYLRFEKNVLPDQLLIDEFVSDVDYLRNDIERLKLKIDRLEKTQQEN